MARSGRGRPTPRRLILDSGAVLALARGERRARAFLARAVELGVPVEVPVVVLAEVLRRRAGDPLVEQVLEAVDAVPEATAEIGRRAGEILGRTGPTSTVAALVVAQAVVAGGAHVLTDDPEAFASLVASHPEVWIQAL